MITDIYRPGSSLIHHFDPRAKLIVVTALVVSFFLPVPVLLFCPYLLCIFLLIALSLSPAEVGRPILTILPILIMVLLLTPPFHTEGRQLVSLWGITLLTSDGLSETVRMIFRFTGITTSFYLFFRTTNINSLVLALRWFGLPFKVSLIVTIAFRYIPDMIGTYSNISDAHKLRQSVKSERTGRFAFMRRFRNLMPVLTSVLIQAIRTIPTLAMTLDLRGVGRDNPRRVYLELKRGKAFLLDLWAAIIMACVTLIPLLLIIFLVSG